MRKSGNTPLAFLIICMGMILLYGCGDSSPDYAETKSLNDSPLQLSIPQSGFELFFEWDEVEGVTEYRLSQVGGSTEVIPGGELLVSGLSATIDATNVLYNPSTTGFLLEAYDPIDGLVEIGNQNGFGTTTIGGEVRFSWAEVDLVTEYRVLADAGEGDVEVIPAIINGLAATIDLADLPYDLATTVFLLEGNDPVDGWIEVGMDNEFDWVIAYFSSPLRLSSRFPLLLPLLKFFWDAVDDATAYRLTQTAGRQDVLSGWQQEYPEDQRIVDIGISTHLFDWNNSYFTLEALIDDVWVFIGEQTTARRSGASIIQFSESDIFTNQLAYGWDIAFSENGKILAVSAIGEGSLPSDQAECLRDGSGPGSGDGSGPGDGDGTGNCDVNGNFLFAAFDSGAVYVTDLEADTKVLLKSPNTGAGDFFGSAIAISDDGMTLVVSAPREASDAAGIFTEVGEAQNNDNALDSGAVYVFKQSDGDWELEAFIKAPNSDEGDRFGVTLSLSGDGDTLAVSSSNDDSDGSDPGNNDLLDSGAVYVFTRDAGIWSEQAYLKASNADIDDRFGHALALNYDGNYLAASSVAESGGTGASDDNSALNAGAVYVFAREGNLWTETSYLKASNADAMDNFGQSLDFDATANLLVVGVPMEDRVAAGFTPVGTASDSSAANIGAAYLFQRDGAGATSNWSQMGNYLKASNPNQLAMFGRDVALSSGGNYITVGAWGEASDAFAIGGNQNGNNLIGAGAAYVFGRAGASDEWEQLAYVKARTPMPYIFFGSQVEMALDGNRLAIGANGVSPGGSVIATQGMVFLY